MVGSKYETDWSMGGVVNWSMGGVINWSMGGVVNWEKVVWFRLPILASFYWPKSESLWRVGWRRWRFALEALKGLIGVYRMLQNWKWT